MSVLHLQTELDGLFMEEIEFAEARLRLAWLVSKRRC